MGGIGSGNWYRTDTRLTVEESLTLAIRNIGTQLRSHSSGVITWTWGSGQKSSISYEVGSAAANVVTLKYRCNKKRDVEIPVRLDTSKPHFGGERVWFTCPLIVDGVSCKRRCGKLYLPPGAHYFGCRKCHKLTYRSCQESHQLERYFLSCMNDKTLDKMQGSTKG